MILKIEDLERSQRETKAGKLQTGVKITATKFKEDRDTKIVERDGEPGGYSRFFTDQFDDPIIAVLEKVGPGGMVFIQMEQDGKFWNPVSAAPYGQAAPSTTPAKKSGNPAGNPGTQSTAQVVQAAPAPAPVLAVPQEHAAKEIALQTSLEVFKVAIVAGILKGKMTLELMTQEIVTAAVSFEEYLTGEDSGVPREDTRDLTDPPDEPGPDGIPDDDIPF